MHPPRINFLVNSLVSFTYVDSSLSRAKRFSKNKPNQDKFFDHRFFAIWVLPFALKGFVFEILFIAPTNNTSPFN